MVLDYETFFVDARTTDIAQDLLVSKFIRTASFAGCMRHVGATKFVLRNSMLLEYFKRSVASTFEVTYFHDKVLAFCSGSDAVLPFKAASAYFSNPAWL